MAKSKRVDVGNGVIEKLEPADGSFSRFNKVSRNEDGTWRVERARRDGGLEIATFSGFMAEKMARLFDKACDQESAT